MADGFIRSPEAVLEVSAYQEARPHWADAVALKDTRVAPAANSIAAALPYLNFICEECSVRRDGALSFKQMGCRMGRVSGDSEASDNV
ncbi:hypothetical protein [Kumtagia ephedrae]|uniref:hypothetical protein n=1 Tax=Kumtagia ephedrae TaxID=2116701 RepID=UPI001FE0BDB1|nr:hypothetical protein [Mesorhizobium ephedrae]